jgi:hypothetical protein
MDQFVSDRPRIGLSLCSGVSLAILCVHVRFALTATIP